MRAYRQRCVLRQLGRLVDVRRIAILGRRVSFFVVSMAGHSAYEVRQVLVLAVLGHGGPCGSLGVGLGCL